MDATNDDDRNDCSLSGTQDILTASSNVKAAPPTVNRPIPTPSIYKDERGEIHNLQVGTSRINLLFSRKGVMRSGDIHQNTQHDFVFSGRVEVWRLSTQQGTIKTIHQAYEYIQIDPFVPHIFHFLEDTVMAEWWEPQGFYAWFYEPYRKLVQASFQPTKPGYLCLLKDAEKEGRDDDGSDRKYGDTLKTIVGSLAVGITMGYFLRGWQQK